MSLLSELIARFGPATVITAAVVYVLLRSDIRFVYPRKSSRDSADGQ